MAEVNIDVAKEASVQAVNTKVGTSSDTASSTPTTLFAGIKGLIAWFTGVWTAARAGYIDTINTNTAINNTASKTGILSQKESYGIGLLENATYGLSALKTAVAFSNFIYVSSNNVKSVQLNSELVAPAVGELKVICNFLPKADGIIKITVNVFLPGGTTFELRFLPYFTGGSIPTEKSMHSLYNLPVGTIFNATITNGNVAVTGYRKIPVTDSVYNNNYSFSIPVIKGFPLTLALLGSYGGKCNYCAISYDEVI